MRRSNASSALQYVPELTWMLFLRILDERENLEAEEAHIVGSSFAPSIAKPYRWQDWASKTGEIRRQLQLGLEGDVLNFVNDDLLPYLRNFKNDPSATPKQKIISEIISVVDRVRLDNERDFLDVIDLIDGISHSIVDPTHMFAISQTYEGLLLRMGERNNDGGQFFTPREVIRAVVKAIDPKINESVYDPCCGTGGFLAQSYEYMTDAVVLMSWMNPTWWLAVSACLRYGLPYFYLTDSNVQTEPTKPKVISWAKTLVLGKFLFKNASGFLYAGETNKQMYQYYGVPDNKLVPFAFSWGYRRFREIAAEFKAQKSKFRAELGIPENDFVILYVGRLSHEKSPELLLEAYRNIDRTGKSLLYVGDGALRAPMESYVEEHGVDSVHFLGFQDRLQIPKYYAVSDALILPSRREATGGVVNEAMAFGLPVIISDQVGFGVDFVIPGSNGFIFPVGDSEALGKYILQMQDLGETHREKLGVKSQDIMDEWLARDLPDNLVQYLEQIYHKPGNPAEQVSS
jgi:glycosyltransferase involved in cell wall biosynthesis